MHLARRDDCNLLYVGLVGTGWDRKAAGEIRRVLQPSARPTAPVGEAAQKPDPTWVEPGFDAEITFAEITEDGMKWHPSFKQLVS
jgi:ATP-dependent DNA ligase